MEKALQLALQHHQAGRLADAERTYREILEKAPAEPNVLHLMGVLAHQTGRHEEAADFIRRAIEVAPGQALFHVNLGVALAAAGQLEGAAAAHQRAVALQPNLAQAHYNLGHVLARMGRKDEAIVALRRAVDLSPSYVAALGELALLLCEQKQWDEGVRCYERALAIAPDNAEFCNNLGHALTQRERFGEAIAVLQCALALRPDYLDAQDNLGVALCRSGDFAAGLAVHEGALALDPDSAERQFNVGVALGGLGRHEEAVAAYDAALALRPDFFDAHYNRAVAFRELGKPREAIAGYRRALAIRSDISVAHWNFAVSLLAEGNFAEGWVEYEARWEARELGFPRLNTDKPLWDGADLRGRRILLHTEQGYGDNMQYARYIPLVAQGGGKVLLLCRSQLRRLFERLPGVAEIITPEGPVPPFDVHCPLASLPGRMGTNSVEAIPAVVPYLDIPAELRDYWKQRVPKDGRPKVGLVWAVKPSPLGRCPPVEAWRPLTEVGGVWFCSLQKPLPNLLPNGMPGPGPAEIIPPRVAGLEMKDWTEELHDFVDTGALIQNLDLVICVDTAIAHLAGALACPVWVALMFPAEWRWLQGRADSPWYPTMRLFRQRRRGDWQTPIGAIVKALNEMGRSRR